MFILMPKISVVLVQDPSLERDMMNGHLLACAALSKVISSAAKSEYQSHSLLLQVSLLLSLLFIEKKPTFTLVFIHRQKYSFFDIVAVISENFL